MTSRQHRRVRAASLATLLAAAAATLGLTASAASADGVPSAGGTPGAVVVGSAAVGDQPPGIDVSHWQDVIDWNEVAASGQRFAFIKATEGRTFDDPNYLANVAGATAAGLKVTAYHFARPDGTSGDAVAEADHFVDVAGLDTGDLLPVLDLEKSGGLDVASLQQWAFDWLHEVTARLGVRPMIYSGPNFWTTAMGDTSAFADAGYRLWLAHWTTGTPTVPGGDWGGRGWTFWQWTDCGTVPGISGCVDLDRYAGTVFGPVTIRRLTVQPNSPDGTVTSDLPGIGCGTTCTSLYDPGSVVTLTAIPLPGAVFLGWGGDCTGTAACTVKMSGNRIVTATFGYPVSVTLAGAGIGGVRSTPPGIDCGTTCTAAFPTGTTVMLTPTAQPGSLFDSWSGDCAGGGACTVSATAPRSLTATFVDDTPPTVTLRPPSGFLGPAEATFDEPVHAVSTQNLVIRPEGSVKDVPTALTCYSPRDRVVDCADGKVIRAELRPSVALIPGQSYTTIADPEGTSAPIVDRGANPAPTTTADSAMPTEVEQGSPPVRYGWRTMRSRPAFGGSYLTERSAGATATFAFRGGSVTWYTITGPNQGRAAVIVDGRSRGTFDQYAPSAHSRVARAFSKLGPGAHTISIRVTGSHAPAGTDSMVAVDAFRVGPTLVKSPPVVQTWRRVRAAGASAHGLAQSDLGGASVAISFRGTGVDWYTVRGPDQGRARILVDGTVVKTVDGYAKRTVYGVRRRIGGLSAGVHTIRIVVLGSARPAALGTNVAIDRFAVLP